MFLKISTKSRYALTLLSYIAKSEGFVSLHEVSDEEGISYGYLEEISASLKKANLLMSKTGRSGGYQLRKKPESIKISEIVNIFEGKTAPVRCLAGEKCSKERHCKTRPVWKKLKNKVDETLGDMTLKDII